MWPESLTSRSTIRFIRSLAAAGAELARRPERR